VPNLFCRFFVIFSCITQSSAVKKCRESAKNLVPQG